MRPFLFYGSAKKPTPRGFFDYTVQHLLPAKERWFAAQPLVDFLQTDRLTQAETAAAVLAWVQQCQKENL